MVGDTSYCAPVLTNVAVPFAEPKKLGLLPYPLVMRAAGITGLVPVSKSVRGSEAAVDTDEACAKIAGRGLDLGLFANTTNSNAISPKKIRLKNFTLLIVDFIDFVDILF
jgi:hypothetical protein